ncbi:voltage-gated potassium channel [Octadecabacter temperatus]|uniref:Voltage-gated potassium channel n=1 Tax=Octadecabacter temperatus TaxID=1458307 RepID=A0A0K0Y535_9RHOB|nr:potassium channel family protein [Octadecabacter temperatus]AKS46055.1 voltage-gated potassium channel [Octadecabacter temperatus]SIO06527.1 voltage-gated potassium channel [Octadecabacter temperatus]
MSRGLVVYLIGSLVMIVSVGTVFFHFVEGWSWLDAYFFTVVTLSTVGYGSLVPVTAVGKIGTTILIFFGVIVVAAVIQHIGAFTLQNRIKAREELMKARHRAAEAEKRADAALERGPDA